MKTIRQQLTRKLLLTLGLLIGFGGVVVYFSARTALLNQFDAALLAKAQAAIALTEQKDGRFKMEVPLKEVRGYEAGASDFLELWQPEDKPVECSRSLEENHLPLRYGMSEAPLMWNLILPNGQPGRAVGLKFIPRPDGDRRNKLVPLQAFIVLASERRDLDRTLATLQIVLAGGGLLLLAATILIVPQLLRRELRPLQRLADEAAHIDAASLSARFPTEGMPGELNPITARLNELLARLEDSFERERRFSSDVAHEFRTPVAELRSLAELAIKLPDTRTENTDYETLAIALQLQSMLTHLLALARGEQGAQVVERQRVALTPLVQDVCAGFQAPAAARGLTLTCQAGGSDEFETDPGLLRSILTNLVDNAVEYTPRGGHVAVELFVNDGRFTVRVENPVDNLEARDLPHLFERFWRKDAARSSNGHTGLGLALARLFAHSVGCELTASFVAPQRLALTLAQVRSAAVEQKA
jgi:two-component system sensor histidine kinase QseC